MGVLAVIGHDPTTMIDCTEVIPVPAVIPLNPHFPAGLGMKDIEQAVRLPSRPSDCLQSTHLLFFQCASTPFPSLKTDPGPATKAAPV